MLPGIIEIIPPAVPSRALVRVPGSKSITNRALVLAALAKGSTTLRGALWSEDTQVMVECLRQLGFGIREQPDPEEPCNRTLAVDGLGGRVPRGGTERRPLDLYVSNAGTSARFLAAMVCLGSGVYRLHGVPRMHERPQAALFSGLRALGYRVDAPDNRLPALVHGSGPRPGSCTVSIVESSQFASALLLSARSGGWKVETCGENAEESPYVTMTTRMIEVFPPAGGEFLVEPDASSGSYFWAASELAAAGTSVPGMPEPGDGLRRFSIGVAGWPHSGWQIDERFPAILAAIQTSPSLDAAGRPGQGEECMRVISRRADLGDAIMTAIVVAALGSRPVRFTDLGRLRLQECERVKAMRTELTRCGVRVEEAGDSLTVFPSPGTVHGAEVETYQDHRMAMCFATLGLKVAGIKIKNPACVRKTFPNFFQKLAAAPPQGLGATIRESPGGRVLDFGALFAD